MPNYHQSLNEVDQSSVLLVGTSAPMRRVRTLIERFASDHAPVLITGESGTGKELVARAIHAASDRGAAPLVMVNCAALSAEVIASELLGYEKGAFAGALARRRGRIEQADGGTLLLEAVNELPVDLQGHLLRFLQDGEIVRVGGHEAVRVDARIIATTSAHLRGAVMLGRFREELYYRLNVLTLHVPALREREDDLEMLARVMVRRIAGELGRAVPGFDPAALTALRRHVWPGNARELASTLRRALVCSTGSIIETDALEFDSNPPLPAIGRTLRPNMATRDDERDLVTSVLERNQNNITRAAHELGVSRVTLYRMLYRNGLVPPGRETRVRETRGGEPRGSEPGPRELGAVGVGH